MVRVFTHRNKLAALAAIVFLSGTSAYEPADKKDAVSADHAAKMAKGLELFKKQVRPILEQKCLRCHGGKQTESELSLNDREGLLKGRLNGRAVVPGHS